jgi:ABC-type uncharacterized transport system permease subunit
LSTSAPKSILVNRGASPNLLLSALSLVGSLAISGLFILLTDTSPIVGYQRLLEAGFSCRGPTQCALITTLQFTTPLILTGLSATVAFRGGLFSIGQAGQMILGAAAAAWAASRFGLPYLPHVGVALAFGALCGALWGWIPGLLRAYLQIHEVITTLVLNQLSFFAIGFFPSWGRYLALRLPPLVRGTKFNAGFMIAIGVTLLAYVALYRRSGGYETRMAGDAFHFALAGGIKSRRAISRAMFWSGGLAGLAGAIEVLGVHYRFVSVFSGGGGFDGIAVALLGQAHPAGVAIAGFLLAGLRLGATNGLQLKARVPRELGGAIIAMMILLISARGLHAWLASAASNVPRAIRRWRARASRRLGLIPIDDGKADG